MNTLSWKIIKPEPPCPLLPEIKEEFDAIEYGDYIQDYVGDVYYADGVDREDYSLLVYNQQVDDRSFWIGPEELNRGVTKLV